MDLHRLIGSIAEMHLKCTFAVIFQGILTSIAKKPYISFDFSGGRSGAPVPSPLDLRMNTPN